MPGKSAQQFESTAPEPVTSEPVEPGSVKPEAIRKGIYRHFKGQLYEVLEIATHSETREHYVVYKPLYGERGVWVRPLAMFEESVERDGKIHRRFTWIEDTETPNT